MYGGAVLPCGLYRKMSTIFTSGAVAAHSSSCSATIPLWAALSSLALFAVVCAAVVWWACK